MGIKKKKTFTQILAVGRFLIFQKNVMFNDCKSNVSAHQSCTIEVFRLENKLQAYLIGLPEYCNTWKCFTYYFETEQSTFFKNKNIDAEVWK